MRIDFQFLCFILKVLQNAPRSSLKWGDWQTKVHKLKDVSEGRFIRVTRELQRLGYVKKLKRGQYVVTPQGFKFLESRAGTEPQTGAGS